MKTKRNWVKLRKDACYFSEPVSVCVWENLTCQLAVAVFLCLLLFSVFPLSMISNNWMVVVVVVMMVGCDRRQDIFYYGQLLLLLLRNACVRPSVVQFTVAVSMATSVSFVQLL